MLKRNIDEARVGSPLNGSAGQQAADAAAGHHGLDFHDLIRIARRRGSLIAGITVIGTLLAVVYSLQLTPRYTAQTLVQIDTRTANVVDTEAVMSGLGRDSATIESEAQLIRSSSVAGRVVDKLGLAANPGAQPAAPSLLGQILGSLTGGREADPLAVPPDPRDQVARALAEALKVSRVGQTYLLTIAYTHPDPAYAAKVVNAVADAYLVDQLESKFDATQRANEWLNQRVGELRDRVQAAERAVEVYRAENNLLQAEGTTLAEQQVAQLNSDLIGARAATAGAKAKLDQLIQILEEGGEPTSFATGAQASAIAELRSKLSDVRREYAQLSARYGERHPEVITIRAQMGDIQRQIAAEVDRIKTATENEYLMAQSREQSLQSSLDELKGTTAETNQAQVTLRELEREAAANRTLYEAFLARFKETSEQESLQTPDSRIVERAAVPDRPSEPNRLMIDIAGLVLSFGFGIGAAFLLERLDNGFRNAEQVEAVTGGPLLASVPTNIGSGPRAPRQGLGSRLLPAGVREKRDRKRADASRAANYRQVLDTPLAPFTEAIRSLRMGLRYASLDNPVKVVLFTSSLPREGKSTIASNLAQHAANTGERVLLIDMDLRHPVLTGLYAPDSTAGFVEVVSGAAKVSDVVVVDEQTQMRFLPASRGPSITHTGEILGSVRVRDFLASCRGVFDLVVIDAPPLLPVVDSRALVGAVDGVVMVVQWEKTSREAVRSAMAQTFGLEYKLLGAVFSQVNQKKARHYSYYESGYYNKKYPYYYGSS